MKERDDMTQNDENAIAGRRRSWGVRGVILVCAFVALASLGACGRKGSPQAPGGATYPQQYPYGG